MTSPEKLKNTVESIMEVIKQAEISPDDAVRCTCVAFVLSCIRIDLSKYETIWALMRIMDSIRLVELETEDEKLPN